MPKVEDKITGETIAEFEYTPEGGEEAKKLADSNINYKIDYAPGGSYNAMERSQTMYMGGGMVKKPIYKKGGKVKK